MTNDGIISITYDTETGEPVAVYQKDGSDYRMVAKVERGQTDEELCDELTALADDEEPIPEELLEEVRKIENARMMAEMGE